MIEINLLEKKKAFKAPVVLGIDFAKLPWKAIIISSLFAKYPVDFAKDYFKELQAEKNKVALDLNNELKKLQVDLRKNQNIKDQLMAFNRQIERLKQRSEQVDKIIKEKTNPRYLLEKVARSAPDDLWLNLLQITDQNEVIINGGAETYRSIGEFLVDVNQSIFFGRTLKLAESKTEEEKFQGVDFRVEQFEIKGEVKLYNPFKNEGF